MQLLMVGMVVECESFAGVGQKLLAVAVVVLTAADVGDCAEHDSCAVLSGGDDGGDFDFERGTAARGPAGGAGGGGADGGDVVRAAAAVCVAGVEGADHGAQSPGGGAGGVRAGAARWCC